MGFGKILGAAATGGISLLGKDKLLGKKDPGRAGGFMFADPALKQALKESSEATRSVSGALRKEMDEFRKGPSVKQLAERTVAKRELGLRAAAEDAIRQGKQMAAQRGMGRSAIGMRMATAPTQDLGEKIQQTRADKGVLMQDLASKRFRTLGQAQQTATGGIQAALGGTSFIKPRKSRGRSGGLLGIGMGVAGAAMSAKSGGNPMQGFGAGQGMGTAMANL